MQQQQQQQYQNRKGNNVARKSQQLNDGNISTSRKSLKQLQQLKRSQMKLGSSGADQSIGRQEDNSTANSNNPDQWGTNGNNPNRRTTSRGGYTQYMGSNNGYTNENGGWVSPMNSNMALYQNDMMMYDRFGQGNSKWYGHFLKFSQSYLIKLKAFTFGNPLPNS